MGLGDMMYHLGIRYGSRQGQEFAAQIIEFVRYHTMLTSIKLSNERGPFPAITGSHYDPENLTWSPPQPLFPHTHDWGRPALDWEQVIAGILRQGRDEGIFVPLDPQLTASVIKAMLQDWYLKRWKYTKRKISVDQYARFVMDFVEAYCLSRGFEAS